MVAEKLLRQDKADLVYMARALIADPELPNKAKEGRLADIRPCITCCRCVEAVDEPPVYCTVNARAGREWDYPLETPAAKQKRVLVVGGGPSGIEAARLAAVRGHRTTLIDQGPRLGGNLILASIANRRIEMLVKYLVRQVRKLTVELRLNTKVTPALVESMKPDAVVLAAGGVYPKLELPGINSNKVIGGNDIKQLVNGSVSKRGLMWRLGSIFMRYFYNPTLVRWALRFNFPIKKRVVIIGGWFASCELADTLAGKGKQVIILEKSGRIGYDIGITHRWVVMRRLRGFGVRMETNAEPLEIIDKGVKAKLGDTEEVIPADSVVLTDKLQPNTELACRMEDKALMFYQIGDCAEPAKIMEALVSGFRVGNEI
jgi:2,4-dienoyl-CoA reductase (NADPH2)